jgi:chemotaxis receptor (MCP) glutamine deamidase CheD
MGMLRPNNATLELVDPILVEMWEFAAAEAPDTLETTGLGPCIGIAAFDRQTSRGHLAHIVAPNDNPDMVRGFLESLEQHTADPSRLSVWVRGGSLNPYDTYETPEYGRQGRAKVLSALASIGILAARTDVRWAQYDEITNMSLDCTTGILETDITPLPEGILEY